jgi:hypothetical protein
MPATSRLSHGTAKDSVTTFLFQYVGQVLWQFWYSRLLQCCVLRVHFAVSDWLHVL